MESFALFGVLLVKETGMLLMILNIILDVKMVNSVKITSKKKLGYDIWAEKLGCEILIAILERFMK